MIRFAFVFLCSLVITMLISWVAEWVLGDRCAARWEGSGVRTEYTLRGGCRVRATDGRWLPESSFRPAPQEAT